jgi:hypothetical protein
MLQKVKASRRQDLLGRLTADQGTTFANEVSQFETTIGALTEGSPFFAKLTLGAPLNISNWTCIFDKIEKLSASNAWFSGILGDHYETAAKCDSNGSSYVFVFANSQENGDALVNFRNGSTLVFSGRVVAKQFNLILYDKAQWDVVVTSVASK